MPSSDLANAFLSAPFEPDGWDAALKQLASETKSARAQVVAFGGPRAIPLNWTTDSDSDYIEEFVQIGGGSPEVNWRVASTLGTLELAWEHHYDDARQRLKSDVYDDFTERFDMVHGCQTVLFDTPKEFYGLATLRSRSDGRTTAADRTVFGSAARHVLTAVKLQQALEHQGAALVAGAIEVMGGAVFVCDGRGTVQALTVGAEATLREPALLRMVHNRLSCIHPDDDRAMQDALRRVLGNPRGTAGGVGLWLRSGAGGAVPVRCEVLPLPRRDWSMGFEPSAIVSILAPGDVNRSLSMELGRLLRLTAAESEVAHLVAAGMSREEIAQARGATVNTVSSQLKSIFMKTDVTREAQLVALLNRFLRLSPYRR